jgi:hypothetical protein
MRPPAGEITPGLSQAGAAQLSPIGQARVNMFHFNITYPKSQGVEAQVFLKN